MLKPWYIAPLLIEQPTWGGNYIADFKSITDSSVINQKIGQAFELAGDSFVVEKLSDKPAFAVASATDMAHPTWYGNHETKQSLQNLIDADPEGTLGKKVVQKDGATLKTLIKFTQGKNNSYQVHVKPGQEFGKWQAKPESWYYFEEGNATLGLAADTNATDYKQRCHEIEDFSQHISALIKTKELTLEQGKQELAEFINQDSPRRFVNRVTIPKNAVVDLASGGIHHSWEVENQTDLGNILYEVQVDVKDEFCTLRSFDQGNIKDDGSVRALTIDDYFQALDTDPTRNQQHFTEPLKNSSPLNTAVTLFDNQYYKTQLLTLDKAYEGPATHLQNSFHHLFTQSGEVLVIADNKQYVVPKGWSLFIPADIGQYCVDTNSSSEVLITSR